MNFIPDSELLKMSIIEDNNRSKSSPKLRRSVTLYTYANYSYILENLSKGNYDEAYTLLSEIKNIVKSVWRTLCSEPKQTNFDYLYDVANTKYNVLCNDKYITLSDISMTFTPTSKDINQLDFVQILYSLIPDFDYDYSKIDFDKYLFIFKNILLSININIRARLKEDKELKIREASTDEEKKEIVEEYEKRITNLKNETIFKTVNYLNYQYYNCPEKRLLVLRTILCRLDNGDYNELKRKNKQLYESKIKKFDKTNASELYKLYIMISIYRFQFITESVFDYLTEYLDIMLTKITGHVISFSDYINNLYKDITNNIEILLLLQDHETIYRYIIENHFQIYSYKIKTYYPILCEYFPEYKKETDKIYDRLNDEHDITTMINKITTNSFNTIENKIIRYNKELVLSTYTKYCLSSAGPYVRLSLDILLNNYPYTEVNERIYERMLNNTKSVELLGILLVCLDDERYYDISEKRLLTIEYSKNYVNDMSDEMKRFIKSKILEYLPTIESGYHKFTLEEFLTML